MKMNSNWSKENGVTRRYLVKFKHQELSLKEIVLSKNIEPENEQVLKEVLKEVEKEGEVEYLGFVPENTISFEDINCHSKEDILI